MGYSLLSLQKHMERDNCVIVYLILNEMNNHFSRCLCFFPLAMLTMLSVVTFVSPQMRPNDNHSTVWFVSLAT